MPALTIPTLDAPAAEAALRAQLAAAERRGAGIEPALRYLLIGEDRDLLNDRIVAAVRGMLEHATQPRGASDADTPREVAEPDPGLLRQLHALALETMLAERLVSSLALDPVVSPLLDEMVKSDDAETTRIASALITAQTRFVQSQRRGELSLDELRGPGEDESSEHPPQRGRTRRELLEDLCGAAIDPRLFEVEQAGVALFATAVARASRQSRDAVVVAMASAHPVPLGAALVASGAPFEAIERSLLAFNPQGSVPDTLRAISADQAAALLAEER